MDLAELHIVNNSFAGNGTSILSNVPELRPHMHLDSNIVIDRPALHGLKHSEPDSIALHPAAKPLRKIEFDLIRDYHLATIGLELPTSMHLGYLRLDRSYLFGVYAGAVLAKGNVQHQDSIAVLFEPAVSFGYRMPVPYWFHERGVALYSDIAAACDFLFGARGEPLLSYDGFVVKPRCVLVVGEMLITGGIGLGAVSHDSRRKMARSGFRVEPRVGIEVLANLQTSRY